MQNEPRQSVLLPNGATVVLPGPVRILLCDGIRYYIVVNTYPPHTITDNVLAVGFDGRVVWRIENILPQRTNSFCEGRICKNGILEFYNTDGWWVSVDRATGQATGMFPELQGPTGEGPERTYMPVIRPGVR